MGPKTPDNSGAQFQDEIDRLFTPTEEEEQEEDGDKKRDDE